MTAGSRALPAGTVARLADGTALGARTAIAQGTPCAFRSDGVHFLVDLAAGADLTLPAGTVLTLPDGSTVSLPAEITVSLEAPAQLASGPVDPATITFETGLLSRFLRSELVDGAPLADADDPWSDLRRDAFPEDFAILDALYAAVLLLRKLDADPGERAAWRDRVDAWGLLDPTSLLGAPLDLRIADAFDRLVRTVRLFAQRARLPGATPTFAEVVADPTPDTISARTGWDAGALQVVAGAGVDSPTALQTLLDRMALVRRTGAPAEQVGAWAAPGSLAAFSAEISRQIVAAARSRHADPDAWTHVARPVRDGVREAQRDALVGYLVATGPETFVDADSLYEHFLIDVSMNPELLTSRTVQAAATVQLFVHRALFGLEEAAACFDDEDRAAWEWMRTYRVWEAARKVFLYPENWIEPELRDDKSPLFTDAEQALAQGDTTLDRAEQVSLDYLDGLRVVGSAKLVACYVESATGSDAAPRLHVFARTHATPPTYVYRRRESDGAWSAWEEVRAGIQGDHLVPVVHDGRWSPKQLGEALPLNASWVAGKELNKATETSYGFVSAVDRDVVTVRCIGAEIQMWVSDTGFRGAEDAREIQTQRPDTFWELGRFSLDPCTMRFEAFPNQASTRVTRLGVSPVHWQAPGFWESGLGAGGLDVYVGQTDPDGERVGLASPVDVLDAIFPDVHAVVPSQHEDFVSQSPFFVSMGARSWLVDCHRSRGIDKVDPLFPAFAGIDGAAPLAMPRQVRWDGTYRFEPFYHPYVCRFVREVRRAGIFGLLDPDPAGPAGDLFRQALTGADDDFETHYAPTWRVDAPYPVEAVDFSGAGAYSLYNWELFFHLPFYVACRLADAGQYQAAIDWFHAMFDPRTRTPASASGVEAAVSDADWWKMKPFLEPASKPVTDWIAFTGAGGDADAAAAFEAQVAAWYDDPFNPHRLARLRPGTYQRAVVMRYLDTLIAWGDHLFAQDSLESINEATQLYVFARQVLGDRPALLDADAQFAPKTWNELKDDLDALHDPLTQLENACPAPSEVGSGSSGTVIGQGLGAAPYFCVPFNARLLSYWDTLDDRLFKIRNGLDISGVARSVPLFQPPIDPALLVRAAAAGVDLGSALADTAPVGSHRFEVMHARARDLAGTVQSLGQALLSALEKRDAEALAMLRQTHEQALLDAVRGVREQQVEEARDNLAAQRRSRDTVEARRKHYDNLVQQGWLPEESAAMERTSRASALDGMQAAVQQQAAVLAWAPEVAIGTGGHVRTGGNTISNALASTSMALSATSGSWKSEASLLTTRASYARRATEWRHQRTLAEKELASLDEQIAAAEIRLDVARRELRNQELQIRHAAEIRDWMERKFTSRALYDWTASQLSALHFQAWQLAYRTAKRAEASYNHELGRSDRFVQPWSWDGSRRGLLAGERLQLDLHRMQVAWLEHDVRELELTRHVSLARLDPLALARLRTAGECFFEVPEALFDLDCPGQYNRRIASVAVTAACVAGPLSQVNLRLTLHGSQVRRTAGGPLEVEPATHPCIVTSAAVEDAGVFSTDPRGARYLPFERLGAISRWHIAFSNPRYRQIDWDSVTDLVLTLRYTTRDGGDAQRGAALDGLPDRLDALRGGFVDLGETGTSEGTLVALSAKRDDPDAWFQARQAHATSLTLTLGPSRLPYFAVGTLTAVAKVHVLLVGGEPSIGASGGSVTPSGRGSATLDPFTAWAGTSVMHAAASLHGVADWPDALEIDLTDPALPLDTLDDVIVALEISVG